MAAATPPDEEVRALRSRLEAAEAKAASLEEWLDAAFSGSSIGMGIISTLENRYIRVNSALAEIYDRSIEEISSADPFSLALKLTHPDDLIAEQKLFAELVAGTRRSYQIEKRFVRRDGSHRFGLLNLTAIFGDPLAPTATAGQIRSALVQVVDISELKAQRAAIQRHEAELRHAQKVDGIGRLAAGVAHDFNNLLTVIIGHGEVLKSSLSERAAALNEPQELPDLDAILLAAERAAALTAQLLAHGRREAVRPKTFLLSDAVRTLQQLLVRVLGSNIEIEQSLAAVGLIHADQGQIGQVLMNLMLNARDAIADVGQIKLATRDVLVAADGDEAPGPGQWVALEVTDSGHGMTAEVRARIFEPFFTTRPDRPGTQGTGLGLATVQRIVAEVSGHIDVKSAPGAGTTVTIFFPRVESAPKELEFAKPRTRRVPALNSRRVLVVEDEPSVRSLIGTVLLAAHYWVMVARNGEEALRFIEAEQEPFHLIVTDLMMPSVGGAALAKSLLERSSPPRMLFISGYNQHTPEELHLFGSFLAKPFTPAQLLAAVHAALGSSG